MKGIAIVTGGGTGIGRSTALRIATTGRSTVVLGRRPDPLEETADLIDASGGNALTCPTDIRDAEQTRAAVEQVVERLGPVEILVNCAGIPRFAMLTDLDIAEYDDVMATNLRGPVVMAQSVLPSMIERGGGSIVNVTSEVAARGNVSGTAYGASKAALNYLTKLWAVELAEHGIRVNAVAPGLTDTEEGVVPQRGLDRQSFLDWMSQRIPLNRPAQSEEIADAIHFLVSPEAQYITGAVLAVDGGISAT